MSGAVTWVQSPKPGQRKDRAHARKVRRLIARIQDAYGTCFSSEVTPRGELATTGLL